MGKRFSVGNHVTWNSEAGYVSGTIIKVQVKDQLQRPYAPRQQR